MKARFVLLLALAACQPKVASPRPTYGRDIPRSSIKVSWSRLSNEFEIMDNVVQWLPAKNDAEYRKWWEEHAPLTDDDTTWFEKYKVARRRSYPAETPPIGLFPSPKSEDVVAQSFYASTDLVEARQRLEGRISAEDADFFIAFFTAYEARLKELHLIDEIDALGAFSRELDQKLDDVPPFAEQIVAAYGQSLVPEFTALYIWWPPGEHTTANNRGRFLLLKYNPKQHAHDAKNASDVVVHEFAHVVSSRRLPAEREALSKTFSDICKTDGMKPVIVLEEPLAVIQQKRYLRATEPKRFEWTSKWYGDPWISTYAKLLFPIYDAHPVVDEAFIKDAAKVCAQLRAIPKYEASPSH